MSLNDRVLQLSRTADSRIPREIAVDGRDRSVFDVLRRRKMRLAHAKVDHVHARLAQLVGFCDHGHGGRDFDAVDAFGNFQSRGSFGNGTHCFPAFSFRFSLYAGSSFSLSRCSTSSGTRPLTSPPSRATSRTSRELRYEYCSAGIMNTVSRSVRSLRFINAICSSYS